VERKQKRGSCGKDKRVGRRRQWAIPEQVQWMSDYGLKFAPAMPGDEAAYTTLRERLASYDLSLRVTAAAEPARPAPKKAAP
jgi:hypothetical protein